MGPDQPDAPPLGDVVIVGAGVSGLAACKAFKQRGCRSLRLFDKAQAQASIPTRTRTRACTPGAANGHHSASGQGSVGVGGHWGWGWYPGMGVQNHPGAYRFSDLPMLCAGERATAADVRAYLHEYAAKHGLHEHIEFGVEVAHVMDSTTRASAAVEVALRDAATGTPRASVEADIVVFACGFVPHMPAPAGALSGGGACPSSQGLQGFQGTVVHSSGLSPALVAAVAAKPTRVVVIGGRKSAGELIAGVRKAGVPASAITCVHANQDSISPGFAPQLWPVALQLPFLLLNYQASWLAAQQQAMATALQQRAANGGAATAPTSASMAHAAATASTSAVASYGRTLRGCFRAWVARALCGGCGVLAAILRWPLFCCGVLLHAPIGGGQVMDRETLRLFKGVRVIRGRVAKLAGDAVHCSGGEVVGADLVVCATGFRITVPRVFVPAGAEPCACGDGGVAPRDAWRLADIKAEQPLLYRSMVLPHTPHISAILFNSMGVNAMFSAEVMATWLAAFYSARGKAHAQAHAPHAPHTDGAVGAGSDGDAADARAVAMGQPGAEHRHRSRRQQQEEQEEQQLCTGSGGGSARMSRTLVELVAADVQELRRRGGDGSFSTWQFDSGAKLTGGGFDKGADFAADFYEEQIYADLGLRLPSRVYALTRAQHDERFYRYAAARLRGFETGRLSLLHRLPWAS